MPENGIEKRKRKLIQRKQKEEEEKEVENRKDNFLTIEPFSIHDWDKDFSIIALEQRAKQLAREYQALKAIHDYSEKLHDLKEHMAEESETSIETQNEVESENEDFGFEVEADEETMNNVEMFSQESETTGENLSMEEDVDFEVDASNCSDLNVNLGAHDVNIEANVEASDASSEIGSIDVGLNSGSGLSGSQGTGSGNVGSGSCGSSGSGSSGGG